MFQRKNGGVSAVRTEFGTFIYSALTRALPMKSANFSWKALLAYLLAAFFLIGSIGNVFASKEIAADYTRWGYPGWFHYLTGALELTTAILLTITSFRFWGATLGVALMLAASATVVLHGEYAHAIPPLVVLAVSVTVAWFNKPRGQP